MQLKLAVLLTCALVSVAHAEEGEVELRGVYYKERATRVVQPMADVSAQVGEHGTVGAHTLVDAITSASAAAGAAGSAFTERRYEAGGRYEHRFGDALLGGAFRHSREPDYISTFGSVRGALELADKSTTLAFALGGGRDYISNAGAQGGLTEAITGKLDTYLASLSVQQIFSPTMLVSLTYDVSVLDGFQENPYRSVVAGGVRERERVPERRFRHAVFASMRRFVPDTRTTVIAGYRLYLDDWGVSAHTPEVRTVQQLAERVRAGLRLRYHWQSRASFFEDIYDTNDPMLEPYLTNDEKLSKFTGFTVGTSIDVGLDRLGATGRLAAARAQVVAEYVIQRNSFGNAVVGHAALSIPFSY